MATALRHGYLASAGAVALLFTLACSSDGDPGGPVGVSGGTANSAGTTSSGTTNGGSASSGAPATGSGGSGSSTPVAKAGSGGGDDGSLFDPATAVPYNPDAG